MSTRFLLSVLPVLLAGSGTDAFAIVRPRKAMIPDYNDTTPSSSVVYGSGLPCTESTQTVTLSSVAPPPSITALYPVNHGASVIPGYPPVTLTNSPSSIATPSVFNSSAAYSINTPTPVYGAPAEASLSNVGKQPAKNTPIVPGGPGYGWPTPSNTTSWYHPTGTGYSGHLPEVISTSLIPYLTSTASSSIEYPTYPTQNAGVSSVGYGVPAVSSSSSSAGYGPGVVSTSAAVPVYQTPTGGPVYPVPSSSSSPAAGGYGPSSSSATPPAYPAATPSSSSVIGEVYSAVSSSSVAPVYVPSSLGVVLSVATPSPVPSGQYGAPATTVTPPVYATSTLATSVESSSSSSTAAGGYTYVTPQPYDGAPSNGASSAIYRA